MSLSDVERISAMVSCLGGPLFSTSELEWATELAAGRSLIQWLASQVEVPEEEHDDGLGLRAALERIALEDEEVQILKRLKQPVKNPDSAPPTIVSTDYLPPSRRSLHCTLLDNLSYSTEAEVTLLKARLQQTKLASKQLSRTVKAIKLELERLDEDIHQREEGLAELSIKMDTTLSHTIRQSCEILDELELEPQASQSESVSQPGAITAMLAASLENRSGAIEHITQQLETINMFQQRLPVSQDLESEASRLQALLLPGNRENPSLRSLAEESAFRDRLREFAELLKKTNDDDGEIYDILQQVGTHVEHDRSARDVDVAEELNIAWSIDQAAILQARALTLESALFKFDNAVLPPLHKLHKILYERQSFIQDTTATLGALEEEMEEVTDHLQKNGSQQEPAVLQSIHNVHEAKFEDEIRETLKQLKSLRPPDLSPLVLLDQNDVLAELRALRDRNQSLDVQEDRWTASLPSALNFLQSTHNAALATTYAHSALNTSPPYNPSPSTINLQDDAKTKSERLVSAVQTLQKGTESAESKRTQRKLKSFVDRWNAVST